MKERLTGAVILVVLVVALVPELLSGPRSSPAQKPTTSADGAPMRSYSIDLAEPKQGSLSPTSAVPPAPTGSGPAEGGESASASAPEHASASPPPPAPAAPAATVPPARPVPPAKPAPPVSPAPPARPAETPRHGAAPAPSHGHEAFVVQLGTFSSRANAERLAQQLATKGLTGHVSEVKGTGRALFRVRLAPAGDRAAADSQLARLKSLGFPGAVIPATP